MDESNALTYTDGVPRVAFIGAGSVVFAKNLIGDLLLYDEFKNCDIALMDIDAERLGVAETMCRRLAKTLKAEPSIHATLDRREALAGSDYVICAIQVGGYRPCTVTDFEIPKKYGLRQTIADTVGIGGIMRGLRTIPVLLDIARDMEVLCPDAWLLQYSNPMAMNCWALSQATRIKAVGLCHSVQGTINELASDLGVPPGEIRYLCAGINHLAFYLELERNGQDLYPDLFRLAREGNIPETNRVRYEMLLRLGYFVTESSEHFSEYCNHFIRRDRPDLIEQYRIPLDEYIRRCEVQDAKWKDLQVSLSSEGELPHARTQEYGAQIVHSIETNTPRVVYGNVRNEGLISDLPQDCCVEVPCLVDAQGVQPTRIGKIPPELAAVMMTNVNVQRLTVEAALNGSRDAVYHAAMLDPHTSAELTLQEIWSMVDDLIEAHAAWLPPLTLRRLESTAHLR